MNAIVEVERRPAMQSAPRRIYNAETLRPQIHSLSRELIERASERLPRVVLQVGDFYESIGFDAVLMVQYAGLNPMGQKLPKAGCPKQVRSSYQVFEPKN